MTTDNLVAQTNALDEKSHTSIQIKYQNNQLFKGIIRIPCYNHTFALAIHDFEQEEEIFTILKDIKKFSLFLRTKSIRIAMGEVCPGFMPTRWTIAFDIGLWLYNNVHRIIQLYYFGPSLSGNIIIRRKRQFERILTYSIPMLVTIFMP